MNAPAGPLGAALTIETATPGAIPEHWRVAWDLLAAEASEPNAFAERWFIEASAPLADAGVRLMAFWGDARLIGVIALTVARRYGRLPASNVQNWLHHHSFLGAPLIAAGWEAPFWDALLAALDKAAWAPNFLHVAGLVANGPVHRGLAAQARGAATVHRERRALLQSALGPQAYYAATVRKKKRKDIARLQARLAELGAVGSETLGDDGDLDAWCDAFLALERSGWKAEAGALANRAETEAFFRRALADARAAGRLDMLRMTLDGRPIAMLVNFLSPPGSFGFKTAYDEDHARFSPGVLIQLANLAVLERPEIAWMDSCATPGHPMIESLWGERRDLVRVTVPLKGTKRRAVFLACRAAERAMAGVRGRA